MNCINPSRYTPSETQRAANSISRRFSTRKTPSLVNFVPGGPESTEVSCWRLTWLVSLTGKSCTIVGDRIAMQVVACTEWPKTSYGSGMTVRWSVNVWRYKPCEQDPGQHLQLWHQKCPADSIKCSFGASLYRRTLSIIVLSLRP